MAASNRDLWKPSFSTRDSLCSLGERVNTDCPGSSTQRPKFDVLPVKSRQIFFKRILQTFQTLSNQSAHQSFRNTQSCISGVRSATPRAPQAYCQ